MKDLEDVNTVDKLVLNIDKVVTMVGIIDIVSIGVSNVKVEMILIYLNIVKGTTKMNQKDTFTDHIFIV